jgi:hypothetical protein
MVSERLHFKSDYLAVKEGPNLGPRHPQMVDEDDFVFRKALTTENRTSPCAFYQHMAKSYLAVWFFFTR